MVRSHGLLAMLTFAVFGVLGASTLRAEVPTEFQPNYDQGYGIGYPLGHRLGLIEGKDRGWRLGTETGTSVGFNTGWSAAYSPAYDLAYDAQYPVGHRAGWDKGVVAGFAEGFDYAPVVAAALSISGSSGINWNGSWSSGNLTIFGTNVYSGDCKCELHQLAERYRLRLGEAFLHRRVQHRARHGLFGRVHRGIQLDVSDRLRQGV